jgi:hypothetical protein
VPSAATYQAVLAVQWISALLIVVGVFARPLLLVAGALLIYVMLCDRLWFHHYRHTMAAFSTLLAFAPCDRHLLLFPGPMARPRNAAWSTPERPARAAPAPLWAQHAIKLQVSIMYLTSSGSKLLDPDWRQGLMMRGMVANFARLVQSRGVPPEILRALMTPLGASLLAKGAIFTELALSFLLWWPRSRRLALWVGIIFHLSISLMTPVRLFTAEMLLVYLLFATPDFEARVLRYHPSRRTPAPPEPQATAGYSLVQTIQALDWFHRFRVEPGGSPTPLVVVARDGTELRGAAAIAEIVGALPVLFLLWPLFAAVALVSAARPHRTP